MICFRQRWDCRLPGRGTFDEATGRLDIHLDFPRGSVFACSVCGVLRKAYDTNEVTWRHLNFFKHQAFLGDYMLEPHVHLCLGFPHVPHMLASLAAYASHAVLNIGSHLALRVLQTRPRGDALAL